MKKSIAIVSVFVVLLGAKFYVGNGKPATVETTEAKQNVDAQEELSGAISTRVADQLAAHFGTSREKITSYFAKLDRLFDNFKGDDEYVIVRRSQIEPKPDKISTEVVDDEPKPLTALKFARAQAELKKLPMVVLITQDGCKPCNVFKREVIEPLRKQGGFDGVHFIEVNRSHDGEAMFLSGALDAPQLIIYTPQNQFSSGRRLIGIRSKDEVLSFLKGSK